MNAAGGMLPAPAWWPTRQPRAPKAHVMKYRGCWFMVYNGRVTWHSTGGTMILKKRDLS